MESLKQRIIRHEGYRPKAYRDSRGFLNIGYGFKVKNLYLNKKISNLILDEKLSELKEEIWKRFSWFDNMPLEIRNVIIEMCYQMGINGFSKFKRTIKAFKERKFELASKRMKRSLWYVQTRRRAKELADVVKRQ